MSITFVDIFCGAGGSSIGLTAAGLELKLAANHWQRAIETHSTNFAYAEHLCADVNNYDMRRLPRTNVLWASPICTEVSPAGGRRRTRGQMDLFEYGPIAKEGLERTRATFHDVIRATEVHRYDVVLVENVVDVVEVWELFDWWVEGMCRLRPGYNVQFVSVSSAHIGGEDNPHAPQWRDRLYMVFTKEGIRLPDVNPRPLAWCQACGKDVQSVQSWKNDRKRKIGKYRQQYVYRCPNSSCRNAIVEPYILPAASAIEWDDLGERIGDRKRPLAAATLRRINAGLEMFARPEPEDPTGEAAGVPPYLVPAGGTWNDSPARVMDAPMRTRTARDAEGLVCPPFVTEHRGAATEVRVRDIENPLSTVTASGNHLGLVVPPFMMNVNHDDGGRHYPVDAAPLPTRSTKIGDGLVCPPFIAELRGGGSDVRPVDHPLATVTASGNHHGLTVPPEGAFYVKNFGGNAQPKDMCKPVDYPFGTVTVRDHHALVVPYYRTGRAKTTAAPLDTLTTKDRFALVDVAIDVDDCRFRMLNPREHLRAQRFPDSYVVTGNKGEQTMQAGNAVSSNVAQWLGKAIAEVLS